MKHIEILDLLFMEVLKGQVVGIQVIATDNLSELITNDLNITDIKLWLANIDMVLGKDHQMNDLLFRFITVLQWSSV